jgi:DNA modification methylase
MSVHFSDDTTTLHHGDSLEVARTLPDSSVNSVVTSPPYFGLRDYGEPGQYGLEASPAEYVETIRALFAELRRVLADDGTLWLNIGDSYSAGLKPTKMPPLGKSTLSHRSMRGQSGHEKSASDVPAKNLLGIPWRVAFALQDDDSGDTYEMVANTPDEVRRAVYLETCRTKTPRPSAPITVNTPSGGERNIQSSTPPVAQNGTQPTGTSSVGTARNTTSCTESKRSSVRSEGTPGVPEVSDSKHSSTTVASSPPVPAAESGTSHSSPSTISTVEAESTGKNSGQRTSPSQSSCDAITTQRDTESCATTATPRADTTDLAPMKTRLLKSQLQPEWLPYFRLVKQDRWILRNSIVWHKPNAMPESVTDRLSGRYESVFLFSKKPRYWFDLDPIREPALTMQPDNPSFRVNGKSDKRRKSHASPPGQPPQTNLVPTGTRHSRSDEAGRNPGDVWTIATSPFPGAHFATMPSALAERCILAGCKPGGTVLDPFSGSGTTGMAAAKHGRKYVGIDLSREYLDLSLRTRLSEPGLDFGEAS